MDELGLNLTQLRDSRYEAVIHLVTAADGAEKFYGSDSNEARYETMKDAIEKDLAIRAAYMGHSKFYLIDNISNKNFTQKIERAK